jgi:hypothetical protein
MGKFDPYGYGPANDPSGTCDWGGCDERATRWRWSLAHGWLPVCEECFRKPRMEVDEWEE